MSASIETVKGLERRLTLQIPVNAVEKVYQSRLQKASKNAQIPGFRPGKVPQQVLETRFGKGIWEESATEVMQHEFQHTIEEKHIHVAGMPRVESSKLVKKGEPLEFVITFEVYPEVKLKSVKGEKIERNAVNIADADIEKMVDALRKQQATWNVVDRAAKIGDRVSIDFEGTVDGQPFEGNKAQNYPLELGSKRMIPGFEDAIVGAKPGEIRDIKVTFPKEYPSENLAGKPSVFKITVHTVSEPQLPELNDAFAEKLGIKEGGIEKLRAEIRQGMEQEAQQIMKNQFKMRVLDKLIEKNTVEVPNALIDMEVGHLQQMTRNRIASQTGKPEEAKKVELPKEPFIEQAKKRVILGLLLGEYIKSHELKVDPAEVKKRVEAMAAGYPKPEEVISWYYNNKKMLAEIEAVVLEDLAVDRLASEMTVEEKTLSYEEAMRQQAE